jgi:adenylate cyclase
METRILSPASAAMLIAMVSVCVFAAVAALRSAGQLQRLELAHYDGLVARSAASQTAPDVVIVSIEEEDLKVWGWPLSDYQLALIIQTLTAADVAAIGIDIYRDNPVTPGSGALQAAFAAANAVWIAKLDQDGDFSIPPPGFAVQTNHVGFSDIPVDFDGVARRALVLVNGKAGLSLSLGTQLALMASGQTGLRAWPQDPAVLMFGQTPVPRLVDGFGAYRGLDDTGYQIQLDYRNSLPVAEIIPARTLLTDPGLARAVKGKVVIVGMTSASIKDNFRTPLNRPPHAPFSFGVQVHAAQTQYMLDLVASRATALKSPMPSVQLLLIAVASGMGAGLGYAARSAVGALVLGPGLGLAVGVAMSGLYSRDYWMPALPVVLAWFLAFLATFATINFIARRQRRLIATLFSEHLSPELSAEIWKSRDLILTGGKPVPMRLYTSILFADLAGSTTIGGSSEPGAFMEWASAILNEMSRIARSHGGFVEKFTGDGILVVFGAPLPRGDDAAIRKDALAACRAATEIAEAVATFNGRREKLAPYKVRIGLHSGEVLAGTLGTAGSLQYNIMGDTVNVAARIEAFGKSLKSRQTGATTICLSHVLLAHAADQIVCQRVGTLRHDDKINEFEIFLLERMR